MDASMEPQTSTRVNAGMFLIEDVGPDDIFTPEDFTFEQRQISQMTRDFAEGKILTQVRAIEAKEWEVSKQLMREADELGEISASMVEAGEFRI
jgi:hypothetical protein